MNDKPMQIKSDIVVSDSILRHGWNVALAAQEIGRLRYLVTTFFYKDKVFPYSVLTKHKRLDKFLRRRYRQGLSQALVKNIPFYQSAELLCRKFYGNKLLLERMGQWRERLFDRHVASFFIDRKVKVFVGYPGVSYTSFRKVKGNSGVCILDLPIGHFNEAVSLLQEEKILCPEFSDSILDVDIDEKRRLKYQLRLKAELEMSDYIVVASKFTKSTLLKNGIEEKKIIIIPHGSYIDPINESLIRLNDKAALKVLFVGQISQRKGIKYLLEAVKSLKEQGLNIELTMVGQIFGSGDGLKKYTGVYNYIPFMRREELKNIYIQHDVFVFPSLFEGFGVVILEALACGLPVITTPHTGDIINDGENGYLVPIRDTQKIADKIKLFYYDRGLLSKMKYEAVKSSRGFTWKKARAQWEQLFNEIRV